VTVIFRRMEMARYLGGRGVVSAFKQQRLDLDRGHGLAEVR
jgi:hypothetical protein